MIELDDLRGHFSNFDDSIVVWELELWEETSELKVLRGISFLQLVADCFLNVLSVAKSFLS